jgi:hypothetical protein
LEWLDLGAQLTPVDPYSAPAEYQDHNAKEYEVTGLEGPHLGLPGGEPSPKVIGQFD